MMATSSFEAENTDLVSWPEEVYQHICDLCIQDNQSIEANAFCSECMQNLCTTCHKAHTRANATKKHTMLTGKDMPTSQKGKSHLKSTCSKHPDNVLENLCYDHKIACCAKCKILDHRYCENLVKLSELSVKENSKEENELKLESLKIILNEFVRLEAVSETFKLDLESDRKETIKTIKESRKMIDDKLDRLEKDMINKIDKEMDAGVVDLEKQKNEITCLMDELKKQVNGYEETLISGAGDQVIVLSSMIDFEIQKYNAVLNELHGNFYKINASFSPDDKLQETIGQICSFGDLIIDKTNADVQRSFSDRQAVYLREVDINFPSDEAVTRNVAAIETLPDGKLLLCDDVNFKIKLFDSSYKALADIKLTSQPCGMALMTPTDVIVSLPDQECLQSLTINQDNPFSLKKDKKHQTNLQYRRLVKYEKNIIAIGGTDDSFYVDIISTIGDLVRRIKNEPLSCRYFSQMCICCLSPDNPVICITKKMNGCIGMSLNGDVVFMFTDEKMELYAGVCTLPGGLVCVTGRDSDNIVIMKSNGEKVKELARLKHLYPTRITYSEETNVLLVKVAGSSALKLFSLL